MVPLTLISVDIKVSKFSDKKNSDFYFLEISTDDGRIFKLKFPLKAINEAKLCISNLMNFTQFK